MSLLPAVSRRSQQTTGAARKRSLRCMPAMQQNPDYPYIARVHQMEGSGVFLVHSRADGRVRLVETVQSTGHPELDKSTITAFQKWRFQVNQPTQVEIPITFLMGQVRTHDPIPVH